MRESRPARAFLAAALAASGCCAAGSTPPSEAGRVAQASAEPGPAAEFRGRTAAAWIGLLDDRDPQVRETALDALAEWGRRSPSVVEALLARTDKENPTHASLALAKSGAAVVPALVARLRDPEPGRRYTAAWTLKEMGPVAAPAAAALAELLGDGDPEVQDVALDAVFALEAEALPLVPELKRVAGSADTRREIKFRIEALLEDIARLAPPAAGSRRGR